MVQAIHVSLEPFSYCPFSFVRPPARPSARPSFLSFFFPDPFMYDVYVMLCVDLFCHKAPASAGAPASRKTTSQPAAAGAQEEEDDFFGSFGVK